MANEIVNTTTAYDQEKMLAAQLIDRSMLMLACAGVLDRDAQRHGTGKTAYFVRYQRMNVPLSPLAEGVTPDNSSFSLQQVTVTLDQWGDVITVTDVAQLTTMHPLVQECINLLAENAQRVIDREIQIVWLAGTNVQYGDGSVTARSSITSSMVPTSASIGYATVTMDNNGAPPRGGPNGGVILSTAAGSTAPAGTGVRDGIGTTNNSNLAQGMHWVAIAGPAPLQDIMAEATAFGSWVDVARYNNAQAVYNMEVGIWRGIRWIKSNHIPRFKMLGNTTAAVTTGNSFGTDTPVVTAVDGGGTLTSGTTYYFAVTRKNLLYGFEEDISIRHSMQSAATSNDESFTFDFSAVDDDYAYNLYFGSSDTDAGLKLHTENIVPTDGVITVDSVPTSTTTKPANIATASAPTAVHPIYIHGQRSGTWVGLQDLEMHIPKSGATKDDPLNQRQPIGYKFMGKAMRKDETRMLRWEIASNYPSR